MTGEQFVKSCFEEKESILKEYFDENTSTEVGERIRSLIREGISFSCHVSGKATDGRFCR